MVTGGLIVLICPVIRMVFFTLLEQKLIGYRQLRVGPNKVRLAGVLQPVLDAVKLFSKGHIFLIKGNRLAHIFFPVWGLMLALIMWGLYPNNWWCSSFVLVIFLCVSGLRVYSVVGGG